MYSSPSDSSGRTLGLMCRPRVVASKSEPSLPKAFDTSFSESITPSPRCVRQKSEPIIFRSFFPANPVKALSLSHLGRGWSITNQPKSGWHTLNRDLLIDTKSLKRFVNVVHIDAGDNHLPFEPFGCFPSLKELLLPLNYLSYFGIQVARFQELQILDLSYNLVIPSSIHGLSLLPVLRWLNLSSNEIDRLPSGMSGTSFPSLEYLILDDNFLGKPQDFVSLCRLPKLKLLSLDRNRVRSLPVIDTIQTEKRNETKVLGELPTDELIFTFPGQMKTDPKTILTDPRTVLTEPLTIIGRRARKSLTGTDTYEWRCRKHSPVARKPVRPRRSRLPASRLLLRHLSRTHTVNGTWPLPTHHLKALMNGIPVPQQRKVIVYDPNVKRMSKQVSPTIESEISQLMITEDVTEEFLKSEETQEEESNSSGFSSRTSTSTLASLVVTEVIERIGLSSEKSTTSTSYPSKSRSSGKYSSSYEPVGEYPMGGLSDNTDSLRYSSTVSESVMSHSANVLLTTTKSSVGKSLNSRTSDVSWTHSESLPDKTSKSFRSQATKSDKSGDGDEDDRSEKSRKGGKSESEKTEKSESGKTEKSDKTGKSRKSAEPSANISPFSGRSTPSPTPTRFGDGFRQLPDVIPPAMRSHASIKAIRKPLCIFDDGNPELPFPALQQLSLVGNKLRFIEDVLAVKTWTNVTELSIKGNPVMKLSAVKLSVMKQQLVSKIKKKIETYKYNDKSIDPFYNRRLVSKLNHVEVLTCPCHLTDSKSMVPTHEFFNLDITQPTPPGLLSLPIPTMRICQYRKTLEDSLNTYREVFRKLSSDPTLSFDTIPLVPFSLRANLFPFRHYNEYAETGTTSPDYSAGLTDHGWPLRTISDSWSSPNLTNHRLPAGGSVYCFVNDILMEHVETELRQVEAEYYQGENSSEGSPTVTNNKTGKNRQKAGFAFGDRPKVYTELKKSFKSFTKF